MVNPNLNISFRKKPFAAAMFIVFILFVYLWPLKVMAQIDSKYGVYVQDGAGVLQQQTQDVLYRNAVWLKEKTGSAQIGVVTVPSLDNHILEDLAVAKFRELGLGSKERNDGVLLFYEAETHHVRIEIGYGLEGRIPDSKAGAILDQYFVPYIKAGEIDNAFILTQTALLQEIAAEYNVDTSEINTGNLPDSIGQGQQSSGFLSGIPGYLKILLIIGLGFLIFLDFKFTGGMITFGILSMLRSGGRGGGGGGWGGRGGGGSSGGGGASR